MPRDDEPKIYRYRDEMPEDLRDHTFYRHYPKTEEEYLAEIEEFMRKFAAENPDLFDANGNVRVRSAHERGGPSPASIAIDLTTFGADFASKLLTEISPAERPLCVAPSRAVSTPSTSAAFQARHPRFDAERHQRYLDAGHRNLCRAAAADHRSAQYASQMRCEIVLTAIVSAQPVPLAIVNPKLKFPPPDEMPLACGIFPVLWTAHEQALVEAESKGLHNSGARPLLSTRARLLYDLLRAMTELKVDNAVTSYCKMFKALGVILDAARQELKQR